MNRLRFLRNEKNENLEKIANFLNMTIQTVSNYETEKRAMSPETIIKLAEYFNVSTDYLLGKSDIRNPEKHIPSSNNKKIDIEGLDDDDISALQKQADYMKWQKHENEKRDTSEAQ